MAQLAQADPRRFDGSHVQWHACATPACRIGANAVRHDAWRPGRLEEAYRALHEQPRFVYGQVSHHQNARLTTINIYFQFTVFDRQISTVRIC